MGLCATSLRRQGGSYRHVTPHAAKSSPKQRIFVQSVPQTPRFLRDTQYCLRTVLPQHATRYPVLTEGVGHVDDNVQQVCHVAALLDCYPLDTPPPPPYQHAFEIKFREAILLRCAIKTTETGYGATAYATRWLHARPLRSPQRHTPVSYTHLRAHETEADL
eukprot:65313-Rhodomonas_salina.1